MKAVLITNDSDQSKALELLMIDAGIQLSRVVIVVPKPRKNQSYTKFIRRVINKLKTILGQDKLTKSALRFEQKCMADAKAQLAIFLKQQTDSLSPSNVPCSKVENVNSKEVELILLEESPDVCAVYGTGIIKENILDLCETFVNAHTSILPHYKGTRSEFWQCFDEHRESIGVTFHKVDKGIDTGAIFLQVHQKSPEFLEPYALRQTNTQLTLIYFPEVLISLGKNDLFPNIQQKIEGFKTYKFSDITVEKRIALYSRLLKAKNSL